MLSKFKLRRSNFIGLLFGWRDVKRVETSLNQWIGGTSDMFPWFDFRLSACRDLSREGRHVGSVVRLVLLGWG